MCTWNPRPGGGEIWPRGGPIRHGRVESERARGRGEGRGKDRAFGRPAAAAAGGGRRAAAIGAVGREEGVGIWTTSSFVCNMYPSFDVRVKFVRAGVNEPNRTEPNRVEILFLSYLFFVSKTCCFFLLENIL